MDTARVTKALYKGISHLMQSEDAMENADGDVDTDALVADMKGVIAAYIAQGLRFPSTVTANCAIRSASTDPRPIAPS